MWDPGPSNGHWNLLTWRIVPFLSTSRSARRPFLFSLPSWPPLTWKWSTSPMYCEPNYKSKNVPKLYWYVVLPTKKWFHCFRSSILLVFHYQADHQNYNQENWSVLWLYNTFRYRGTFWVQNLPSNSRKFRRRKRRNLIAQTNGNVHKVTIWGPWNITLFTSQQQAKFRNMR